MTDYKGRYPYHARIHADTVATIRAAYRDVYDGEEITWLDDIGVYERYSWWIRTCMHDCDLEAAIKEGRKYDEERKDS